MIKRNFYLFNVLFTFLFLTGCATGQTSKVKNLTQAEFKKTFEGKADAQIMDVRTPQETSKGKIAHAVEADYFDPNFKAKVTAMKLDKSKPIVVYCAVGGRSSKAALILSDMGFKNVLNLEGGYNSYRK
jgi:rhodanese-related sulfurtransferase